MKYIPWGPIRSLLTEHFSFGDIKKIIGYSGIDVTSFAHLEQKAKGGATKSQLLSAIDKQLGQLEADEVGQVASICCEEMPRNQKQLSGEFERVLLRVGWEYTDGTLLPLEIFKLSELKELPKKAHKDLEKAAVRLRDGDLSGSISACCGALDNVTEKIYKKFGLGDHKKSSFQERISKSLKAIKYEEILENDLKGIGWSEEEIKIFSKNLSGSLNQASNLMQKIRANMGDVHGTKPVINALVFDSIKWASILLRILNIK